MRHRMFIKTRENRGVRRMKAVECASLCVVLLAYLSTTAVAQQSADPIQVCSRMTDTAARLACFDQVAAQQRAPAAAAASTQSLPHAAASPPDDTTGLDPKQIRIRRQKEGLAPEPTKVIVSTLARLDAQPTRHYHFELDNGQVWASTNAESDLFLKPHETVQIRPGILGAFFLKTAEGSTLRVYRLR